VFRVTIGRVNVPVLRIFQSRAPRRRGPKRRRLPLAVLGCWLATGYFAHHAVYGKHGLEARTRLTERHRTVGADVKALEATLAALKRDVAALTPDVPDADLVAEIAGDILGFVPLDALVVTLPARR
jgi:cell division protein FtsB